MIVGDKNVGKWRLSDFLQRNPINDMFTSERNKYKLDLWHVSGAEDNADLRYKAYQNTKVCLILFNVADAASFANVERKWAPEINKHCSDALLLLIGTKREGQQNRPKSSYELPITKLQGHILAKKIKAVKYVEYTW